jgi:hypothetical protein
MSSRGSLILFLILTCMRIKVFMTVLLQGQIMMYPMIITVLTSRKVTDLTNGHTSSMLQANGMTAIVKNLHSELTMGLERLNMISHPTEVCRFQECIVTYSMIHRQHGLTH